jgi:methylenetetrahydrofolate dehydrogenase (NADP+) / methenyltetrahydrofolate cyclohydrolase
LKLLKGIPVSEKILHGIKDALSGPLKRPPCLVFVLVGNHAPSMTYVSMKVKACEKVGIHSRVINLDENIGFLLFKELILDLNQDDLVDGVIVQMPLPKGLETIPMLIDPSKDVDGFTHVNVGKLCQGDLSGFISCTPQGIFYLLREHDINLENKHVVILGRSNIVGKPLANLLSLKIGGANATVTLAHSGSENLKTLCQKADILISAIGKPEIIDGTYIKQGAYVIDVGINRVNGKIVGDCHFESMVKKAAGISPVPGGVGPMTIACLLLNTYLSYKEKFKDVGSSMLCFDGHLLKRMT